MRLRAFALASFSVTFLWTAFSGASRADAQTFRSPLECSGCIGLWNYFDQDDGAGTRDWNCQSATYNGHRGTDLAINGSNDAIDDGYNVVAAANGVVVAAQDGHFDRCRTCNASVDSRCGLGFGGGFGNHIVINHGPYRVIYAHLRTGSVRVSVGDTVTCGEAIGQVGSSGCSTGAHLHFETRTDVVRTSAFDPFEGGCSSGTSRWTSQGPHRGLPSAACDGAPVCPSATYAIWTCNAERTQRRRCIDGMDTTEPCPYGCQSMPVGTDDTCAPAPDSDGDGSPADEDCDDTDPGRRPGLMEVCGDGVDQDCDGSDLLCPGDDAGPSAFDAGLSLDGGPGFDVGVQDAGVDVALDDGERGGTGTLTSGCSCRVGVRQSAPGWWLAGFVVLFVRRRKR